MLHFETNLDLLYFTLTVSAATLTFLLAWLLVKALNILGDIQKTTSMVKETAELINEYAWKPIEILMHLKTYITSYLKK